MTVSPFCCLHRSLNSSFVFFLSCSSFQIENIRFPSSPSKQAWISGQRQQAVIHALTSAQQPGLFHQILLHQEKIRSIWQRIPSFLACSMSAVAVFTFLQDIIFCNPCIRFKMPSFYKGLWRLRYSLGVTPSRRLNIRVNVVRLKIPTCSEIWFSVISVKSMAFIFSTRT